VHANLRYGVNAVLAQIGDRCHAVANLRLRL